MSPTRSCLKTGTGLLAVLIMGMAPAVAGPPFQTDDPEPIEYKNYEFYVFGTSDATPREKDVQVPAFEFNWGALPNVHLHIIVPGAGIFPSNDPKQGPDASGPRVYGMGDIELGIKYRFVQETKTRPMIGTFTMFEIPTGDSSRGLGVGKVWYKLPIWVQKSFGPWTTYGGGGETVFNNVPGYRNFPFAGWLLQRDLGKKLTLSSEVFYHGPEGPATPLDRPATMLDFGGYYKFHGDSSYQLLFCYGHSIVGATENYAYLGLYWTWGKKDDKDDKDKPGDNGAPAGSALNQLGPHGTFRRL